MNNWDDSAIMQTNEVGRRVTPNSDNSAKQAAGTKRKARDPTNQLLEMEDLQKIRRSNHSVPLESDRLDPMEDECENDGTINRLMYPGLEATLHMRDVDCDFFEDDYFAAQEAVRLNESMTESLGNSSRYAQGSDDNNHAVHRRSFDAFATLEDDLAALEARHYAATRQRQYYDVSQQKPRR
jgi:hypothetical protein